MLNGTVAGLRARHESDIPILETELYDDVDVSVRADSRPWRPIPPGSASSRYRITGQDSDPACFSVVELATAELAGEAVLADNAAMIRAATQAGFVPEGLLRRSAWVNGVFADEVILGQLAAEWSPA
jgi:RimJ/RimL family protein N-acetyltransferase